MTTSASDKQPRALVRRPSPRLAEGLVTHIERSDEVDADLALQQWQAYVAALVGAGYEVLEAEETPDLPDGVFLEDTMVVAGDLAVITSMQPPPRAPEVDSAREAARAAGLTLVELGDAPLPPDVAGPVQLDGGDVLKVGRTAYVGVGGRTTRAGAAALARHQADAGYQVETVPVSRTLHLKSQVTALPDGTVVGWPPLVDDPRYWEQATGFLAVPEEEGAHVIVLGEQRVLLSDAAPQTVELYAARGLSVVTVPTSEIAKLEGCVTCLSVRLHAWD